MSTSMTRPTTLTARLKTRVSKLDRGLYFEDPLSEALVTAGLGDVVGGAEHLDPDGEIDSIDLHIEIFQLCENALQLIVDTLEDCGAPRGSTLLDDHGRLLCSFGQFALLAMPLDGTGLPPKVYAGFDVMAFLDEARAALGAHGAYRGNLRGPRYTTLYFAGPDYTAMALALQPLVSRHPICGNTTLTQVA